MSLRWFAIASRRACLSHSPLRGNLHGEDSYSFHHLCVVLPPTILTVAELEAAPVLCSSWLSSGDPPGADKDEL